MGTREDESLTSLEALAIAIRAELDARDVYRELAERCEEPLARRRFELLAAEEECHHNYLTGKWQEMAGGVPLRLPASQLPRGMRTSTQRRVRTVLQVVDMALAEEGRSRAFYLRAARETEDLSGKAMFRFLADMEHKHWMELAEERALLERYPNYGRPGAAPWRAEASLTAGDRRGT